MQLIFPRHPFFRAAAIDRRISFFATHLLNRAAAGLTIVFLFIYGFERSRPFLGAAFLSFASAMVFSLARKFVAFHRRRGFASLPEAPATLAAVDFERDGLQFLTFEAAKILMGMDATSAHPVFDVLVRSPWGKFFLARLRISSADFRSAYARDDASAYPPPKFADLLKKAAELARADGRGCIAPHDLAQALALRDRGFSGALAFYGLTPKDLDYIGHWFEIASADDRGSLTEKLLRARGIGKSWAYGYTVFLDRHSEAVRTTDAEKLHIVAHEREIRELEAALAKMSGANAVIVGDPGVGKMTIVHGLAERIGHGMSLPALNYRRVVKLRMQEILAERATGGIAEAVGKIFREAERAGNVILVIEDIDLYLAPGAATRVAELLMPFLRSQEIKLVGLTTPDGYAKSVTGESALAALFHEIRIEEPDEETTMKILADTAHVAEKREGVGINYLALRKMYDLALRYVSGIPFPEKAVVLLEEGCAYARGEMHSREVTPDMIERVLERRYGTALGDVAKDEKETLVHLEEKLRARVVGQEEAITALADAIRRKRAGLGAGGKPVGSFLFLGPTGVGKTETAKALAEAYYGSEERMVRFDMSEYQNPQDLGRLIGIPSSGLSGRLTQEMRDHPFSLVLLDEIEKAHPNILNLFLQILDEGHATDAYGKRVDFSNTIIIGTSNAGSEFIRERIAARTPYSALKAGLIEHVLSSSIFATEFLNRFDGVIVYSPLTEDEFRKVAELLLGRLAKRLEREGYRLSWEDALLSSLATQGYSETFGGRALNRVIQEKIESRIAKDILAEKYRKGDTIPALMETSAGQSQQVVTSVKVLDK